MPGKPKGQGKHARPTYNQAHKIITRFGGEPTLARLLSVRRETVYKWNYARPIGTDGLIPADKIDRIRAVARLHGIIITKDDWTPEVNTYDGKKPESLDKLRAKLAQDYLLS